MCETSTLRPQKSLSSLHTARAVGRDRPIRRQSKCPSVEVSPRHMQVAFKVQKFEYLQAVVVDHRQHWGWAANHGSLKMWKMDDTPPISGGGSNNTKSERCKEPSTLVFLPVRRLYQPLSTCRAVPSFAQRLTRGPLAPLQDSSPAVSGGLARGSLETLDARLGLYSPVLRLLGAPTHEAVATTETDTLGRRAQTPKTDTLLELTRKGRTSHGSSTGRAFAWVEPRHLFVTDAALEAHAPELEAEAKRFIPGGTDTSPDAFWTRELLSRWGAIFSEDSFPRDVLRCVGVSIPGRDAELDCLTEGEKRREEGVVHHTVLMKPAEDASRGWFPYCYCTPPTRFRAPESNPSALSGNGRLGNDTARWTRSGGSTRCSCCCASWCRTATRRRRWTAR